MSRGTCRGEGLRLGEHVPDGRCEIAGQFDPGDARAAPPEAAPGALVPSREGRMTTGVGRGLDERPAQVRRPVLGQTTAPVPLARLVYRRAESGVPDELLGAR